MDWRHASGKAYLGGPQGPPTVLSIDQSRVLAMLGPAEAPLSEELSYRAKLTLPRTGEIIEDLTTWGLLRIVLGEGGRPDFRVTTAVATLCDRARATGVWWWPDSKSS